MKKSVFKFALFFVFISLVLACTDKILIFPEWDVPSGGKDSIQVVLSPEDVAVIGGYDYRYVIRWPEQMNSKIAKVHINYKDNDVEKTIEATSFKDDIIFTTESAGLHHFVLVAYSADSLVSNKKVIDATNHGYVVDLALKDLNLTSLSTQGGTVNFSIPNVNKSKLKVTLYQGEVVNESPVHTFLSNKDMLSIPISFDGQFGVNSFVVEVEDENGRKATKIGNYNFEYSITVSPSAVAGRVNVNVKDNMGSTFTKIKASYPSASGGSASTEISSGTSILFPASNGINIPFQIEVTDLKGRVFTKNATYSHVPSSVVDFDTSEKAKWTLWTNSPYHSNWFNMGEAFNGSSSGPGTAGATFRMVAGTTSYAKWENDFNFSGDGNTRTFRFHFTQSRQTSNSGAYKEDALRAPNAMFSSRFIDEIKIDFVTPNEPGANKAISGEPVTLYSLPTTIDVYGIKEDKSLVLIGSRNNISSKPTVNLMHSLSIPINGSPFDVYNNFIGVEIRLSNTDISLGNDYRSNAIKEVYVRGRLKQ